ncbi:hypothetical protein PGIGA_G00069490, partial [Pangasianodon gigas]|nr:hypothetical protein [Pangasianodon gigas]
MKKQSVERWTLHARNCCRFDYVAEKGRGYQALTLAQICSESKKVMLGIKDNVDINSKRKKCIFVDSG